MFILIDCRACGGNGCRACRKAGTQTVAAQRPLRLAMPDDENAFAAAREACPCYQGISVNPGVSQCTHADHKSDGEWCDIKSCPAVVRITKDSNAT